jgi:hypothetical protein
VSTTDPTPTQGLDRRDMLRLGGLIAMLLAVVGIVLLASGGGSTERSSGQLQGVLTDVTQSRLVLKPTTGGQAEEFAVRPEDAQKLDFFHLETHAADALQSIVYYDQVGDTKYATRVEDAPTPAG